VSGERETKSFGLGALMMLCLVW